DAVVLVEHVGGVLVVEAAHGGTLDGGGVRVVGVDLHHPAVAFLGLGRVPVVVGGFFAGQVGAPGRGAAGTVVQRADHGGAHGRGGGAADVVDGIAGVALVVARIGVDRPLAVVGAGDLDHRDAHVRQVGAGGVGGQVERGVVDILVVQDQQAALVGVHAFQRVEVHAVVLAAGLGLGGGRGLREAGLAERADHGRVAGRRQHLGHVALGHGHGVGHDLVARRLEIDRVVGAGGVGAAIVAAIAVAGGGTVVIVVAAAATAGQRGAKDRQNRQAEAVPQNGAAGRVRGDDVVEHLPGDRDFSLCFTTGSTQFICQVGHVNLLEFWSVVKLPSSKTGRGYVA